MLHIINIAENDYDSYAYNSKRHYVVGKDYEIVEHDYILFRWDNNSMIFYVIAVEDSICSLVSCRIMIDEVPFVSRIENNDYYYELPFS